VKQLSIRNRFIEQLRVIPDIVSLQPSLFFLPGSWDTLFCLIIGCTFLEMSSETYVAPNPMQGAGYASEGFPPAHPSAPQDASGTTGGGVAPNPMSGNSGSPSGNNRQARVSVMQLKASQGVVLATTAFKDKPYLSTAVLLSAFSVAFMVRLNNSDVMTPC
jgi:hypothetical protein